MKYIVTPQNIKSIAGTIKKVGKDKTLIDQLFYPTSKKRSTIRKNINLESRSVIESSKSFFTNFVVETDTLFGEVKPFIRVHNNDRSVNDYGWNNYLAFIIYCGDVVEFKNNQIYVKTLHPTNRKEKANQVIKFI